jgi:DNA modification methylase
MGDGLRAAFPAFALRVEPQERLAASRINRGRMTEPVIIGRATLYLGDCRDILPTLPKVDAVVTDPPYGINAARDRNSEQWGWRDYGSGEWDLQRPDAETLALVLASGKHAVIWGGNYFPDVLPPKPLAKWLVWDKCQEGFSLADVEFAWCSFDGAIRRIRYARARAMQDGKEHPTQKSLTVMKWCLDQLPKGCSTILDPFLGSGTTGCAAVSTGRDFIGIERHEPYFDIACKRIDQAQRQGDFFVDKVA